MPFEKGHSGGPGRPKDSVNIPDKYKGKTLKQICRELSISVAMPTIEKAAHNGNIQASELILAYGFGKPVQQINQVSLNLDYSSWSDKQIEEFGATGQMPMLQGDSEDKPNKNKEVKEK
jgi:hypothetical protein